jgi:site-specific recombinase XerD
VLAFGRLSSWAAGRGIGLAELTEDVIDEYVALEQIRSGSRFPAAFQYLPAAKRFLASQGVLTLRDPAPRGRGGIPRLASGPLTEVIPTLVGWLRAEGYAPGSTTSVACTAARLGAWMAGAGQGMDALDEAMLDRFVAAQDRGPLAHPSSARRIAAVRAYLRAAGLLPVVPAPPRPEFTPVEEALAAWGRSERDERGLGDTWVREQHLWVRGFLDQLTGPDGQVAWEDLQVRAANEYVAARGRGYSLSSRRHLVSAMRSLLRWALRTGRLDRPMAAAVLGPPRRTAGPARALTAAQVEAITAAADTGTPLGLRDHAVIVMISRLGLRAGEVAGLSLDDVDWHAGQLTVRGKGGRVLTLPLPTDVGEVLVGYLRQARPAQALDRSVFLRVRPPLHGLSAKGISGIVAARARRAGLGVVHAHRLRHTAATGVLAGGGSLSEARELLGHARTDTTMIYARADLTALSVLVTGWGTVPGS